MISVKNMSESLPPVIISEHIVLPSPVQEVMPIQEKLPQNFLKTGSIMFSTDRKCG